MKDKGAGRIFDLAPNASALAVSVSTVDADTPASCVESLTASAEASASRVESSTATADAPALSVETPTESADASAVFVESRQQVRNDISPKNFNFSSKNTTFHSFLLFNHLL